jgi:hypothetical protein
MMLREHFSICDCIPQTFVEKFQALKDTPSQGATDSKRYWMYSAMKLGLTDSTEGIKISEQSVDAGAKAPAFGSHANKPWPDDATKYFLSYVPLHASRSEGGNCVYPAAIVARPRNEKGDEL